MSTGTPSDAGPGPRASAGANTAVGDGTGAAVLALVAATLFWAGNYVVGGAAVHAISPVDLTALRWAIALGPLLLLAQVVERPDWRAVARSWPQLIPSAVLGLVAYNLLLYSALQHTTAADASLINAFNPAMISVAAALLLRQRLTTLGVTGILIALAGVLWVLSDGHPAALLSTGLGIGDLLMIAAITAWTAYTLLGRRRTGIPPITSTALQVAIAVALLTPVVLATGGAHLPTAPGPLWALAYIGLFPSVVSYVLWNRALLSIPPARAGVFLNMITVFTVLITIALGHPFTTAQLLGGLAVLGGVVLTNLEALRRAPARADR